MKGDSGAQIQLVYPLALVISHIASATAFVFFLHVVSRMVEVLVPDVLRALLLVVVAAWAMVQDCSALRRRTGISCGLARQTPKGVAQAVAQPWWVVAVVWGVDTGLIWSTFRVSALSWVLLIGVVIGSAPAWSGVAYGLSFGTALLLGLYILPAGHLGRVGSAYASRGGQYAQAIGVVLSVMLIVVAGSGVLWDA